MTNRFLLTLILYLFSSNTLLRAQTIKVISAGNNVSIRGLSVVSDKIIWLSGSNGTIGRSIDSGNTWKWITIKGFETTEFRDIEAFNE